MGVEGEGKWRVGLVDEQASCHPPPLHPPPSYKIYLVERSGKVAQSDWYAASLLPHRRARARRGARLTVHVRLHNAAAAGWR